jgi:hypothetical protein
MKYTTTAVCAIAAALVTIGSLTEAAKASVSFSQVGSNVSMTVTNQSYTLTTNQTQDILYVAFLDVFPVGGSEVFDTSRVAGSASSATYSINGGPAISATWWTGWQYRPGFQAPWTPEDVSFLLDLAPGTLSTGDTITINGTLTMNAALDADIILPTITSSTQTVIGGHDFYYSSPSLIPEPSAAFLVVFGALGSMSLRRRSK